IAGHRADQDTERQNALGDLRDAEQRDLGDQQRRDVGRVRQPAHLFDVVEQDDQHEDAGHHGRQRAAEFQAEVTRQRAGHWAVLANMPARLDNHSMTASTVRTTTAGGSMIMPRPIAARLPAVTATMARYWKAMAAGCLMLRT